MTTVGLAIKKFTFTSSLGLPEESANSRRRTVFEISTFVIVHHYRLLTLLIRTSRIAHSANGVIKCVYIKAITYDIYTFVLF